MHVSFMCALTAVYGETPLLRWNAHFPTRLERYIWRITCSIVAGGITVAAVLLNVILIPVDRVCEKIEKKNPEKSGLHKM